MTIFLVVLCIVFFMIAIFSLWLFRKKTNVRDSGLSLSPMTEVCDFSIKDEYDTVVVEAKEIFEIPKTSMTIGLDSPEVRKAVHLAADVVKGIASVPNKTIEIVFSPQIQLGIEKGLYKINQYGDAISKVENVISSTGKRLKPNQIAEKGKLIQTGQIRQIAAAGFQMLSIVVAQSHLADINKNLNEIKGLLEEIKESQENNDLSKIEGSIEYLRKTALDIGKFFEISEMRKKQIEHIARDFLIFQSKLELDFKSLIKRVSQLKDEDTFGTGNTYTSFKNTIEDMQRLQKRRELLLRLEVAFCYVCACIDPTGNFFTKIDQTQDKWNSYIKEYETKVKEKCEELLSTAKWGNTRKMSGLLLGGVGYFLTNAIGDKVNKTIDDRKSDLIEQSETTAQNSIKIEKNFQNQRLYLEKTLNSLTYNGKTHMAIRFDDRGEPVESALLRKIT